MTRALFALIALLMLSACHSRNDDDALLFSSLSADNVELIVGQKAIVTVYDAREIKAASEDESVATATVEGDAVIITGVSVGQTSVTITGDRRLMRCRVVVKPGSTSVDTDPDAPQEPEDLTEMADEGVRYVSKMLTMRYDTPGTMFMSYADGRRVAMRSLDTGDAVTFDFGTVVRQEGPLEHTLLDVNGEAVDLDAADIVRLSADRVWVRLHTTRWNHTVWFVAPVD